MSAVMSMPLTDPTPPAADLSAATTPGAPVSGTPQFQLPSMGMSGLTRNPMLPQHPLGAYTDAFYEAQVAQLKQHIASQYNDVLQQLGYTGPNGEFVPGTVEIEANKQRSQLGRNLMLADEGVTQQHQREGTLFSGMRGTNTARAEFPFQSALADIGVQVPQQLSQLYEQAGGLVNQFNTQHNLLLAEAAQRAAANLANNSAAGGANVTGIGDPGAGGFAGAAPSPLGGISGSGVDPAVAVWGPGGAIPQAPAGSGLTVPNLPQLGTSDAWSRLQPFSAPPLAPATVGGSGGGAGRSYAV